MNFKKFQIWFNEKIALPKNSELLAEASYYDVDLEPSYYLRRNLRIDITKCEEFLTGETYETRYAIEDYFVKMLEEKLKIDLDTDKLGGSGFDENTLTLHSKYFSGIIRSNVFKEGIWDVDFAFFINEVN